MDFEEGLATEEFTDSDLEEMDDDLSEDDDLDLGSLDDGDDEDDEELDFDPYAEYDE